MAIDKIQFGQMTVPQVTPGVSGPSFAKSKPLGKEAISLPEMNPFGQLSPDTRTVDKGQKLYTFG